MRFSSEFNLGNYTLGLSYSPYFIAEIGSNFDGDIERAKDLICLAKESGAHAAKFQHYTASGLVSDRGFSDLGSKVEHQAQWENSVFETYKKASLPIEWTAELEATCIEQGIEFLTSPYSLDLIDKVSPFVSAFKVGSGDITYVQALEKLRKIGKPVLLATGASTLEDVDRAVQCLTDSINLVLMQCNTNYKPGLDNLRFANLNVLDLYSQRYPGVILGLSDHTSGCSAVLGAIAKGARVIEKHFTDSVARPGPDHPFSMMPKDWKLMMSLSYELFESLGDGVKRIEANERKTVIVQRRGICAARDLQEGTNLKQSDLSALRPCPEGVVQPYELSQLLGQTTKKAYLRGEMLFRDEFNL